MTYAEKLLELEKRNRRIIKLRKINKWTYEKIGEKFGVSKQRISAIIKGDNELSTDERK